MSAGTPLIRVEGLSVALGRRAVIVDLKLSIGAGEFVAIVGPNGAGKTTLLKAAAGIIPADGRIVLSGRPMGRLSPAERARAVAYLPQGHVFYWPLPVADVVALGRLPRGAGADLSAADIAAVRDAMASTGTSAYAARAITTLSGGERARVALARVLATEAPLILADEPTASLDPRYQIIVLDILAAHATAGGAVVAVLHDLGLAARYADRVVVMDRGKIVAEGPTASVLTEARLASTFGVEAALVEKDGRRALIPWSLKAS